MDTESSRTTEYEATVPQTIPYNTLIEYMNTAGVPIELYGTGDAKTIQHLLTEVHDGETVLSVKNNGELVRSLSLVAIDVFCRLSNGSSYILKEDRQEFNDGRIIRRQLDSSLGEKLKPNESPEEAVVRALQEELQLTDAIESLQYKGATEKSFMSPTYPGILSTYKVEGFKVAIVEDSFKPEGYSEVQLDKTNYYVWEPLQAKDE